MSSIDIAGQITQAFKVVAFVIACLAVFHFRSSIVQNEKPERLCKACRYPGDGLPENAACPECGSAFIEIRFRRETWYDWRGLLDCAVMILLIWSLELLTPYVWAAFYRSDGWSWMTATHRPCAYRSTPLFHATLCLAALVLPILSRIPLRIRRWGFLLGAVLIVWIWYVSLTDAWASGRIYWHNLGSYPW